MAPVAGTSRRLDGWRPRLPRLLVAGVALAALGGCGMDFDQERQRTMAAVARGDHADAHARLNWIYDSHDDREPDKPGSGPEDGQQVDEKNRLLWRVERGLVAAAAGDYAQADRHLDEAAVLVDLARTERLTDEVGTWLLNDNVRDYAGRGYEHIQVDYWRAVCRLAQAERSLGLLASALPRSREDADEHYERAIVRARRLALEQMRETADAAGSRRYQDDPFARFLAAAVVYALPPRDRTGTDQQFAQVNLRRALEAYEEEREALGGDEHFRYEIARRPRLVERLFLRHLASYDPGSYDELSAKFGLADAPKPALPKGHGMLLLLDHVGFAARPEVLSIGFGTFAPSLSDRDRARGHSATDFRVGALGFWAVGPGSEVAGTWVVPIPDDAARYLVPGGIGVFGMQMPVHDRERPLPALARLVARPLAAAAPTTEIEATLPAAPPGTPFEAALEVVSDIDAYARATLKDEQPRLLAKTLTRVVAKQVAAGQAAIQAKKAAGGGAEGQLLGAVVGLLGSATATFSEQADTRAVTLLPDHVSAALIDLPAGSYSLELVGPYGARPIGTVVVPAGQLVVVPTRTFPEPVTVDED